MTEQSVIRRMMPDGQGFSLLGFGCMRFPRPDPEKPDIDETASVELIQRALGAGINYFDTAWPYHSGQSEGFIGRALKGVPREQFLLADKLPTWEVKSEADVPVLFAEQLCRCQVDYFDCYLVHNLNPEHFAIFEANKVYEQLLAYKRAGKIRRLGFSFHGTPELLRQIVAGYEWDFVQIQLNYLDWELQNAKEQYEILRAHGLPIIVMEPVRGGALANLNPAAQELLEAGAPGQRPAALALRYAASMPGVVCVLSGMTQMEQLEENIATFTDFAQLEEQELKLTDALREAYLSAGDVPCTGCRYCSDCPSGVEIPTALNVYNQFKRDRSRLAFLRGIDYLEEHGPASCTGCGACVPHCPQGIDIPARLADVRALYTENNF